MPERVLQVPLVPHARVEHGTNLYVEGPVETPVGMREAVYLVSIQLSSLGTEVHNCVIVQRAAEQQDGPGIGRLGSERLGLGGDWLVPTGRRGWQAWRRTPATVDLFSRCPPASAGTADLLFRCWGQAGVIRILPVDASSRQRVLAGVLQHLQGTHARGAAEGQEQARRGHRVCSRPGQERAHRTSSRAQARVRCSVEQSQY
mmetsp:Transcript_67580/g.180837  ORF Transcript_67580/g.180837 Transcript_67580/m.180837 type:complete len:202 (-) Transcript_67580:29-634(-)